MNHVVAQMLAMAVNKRQDGWDAQLSHIEFVYKKLVSATAFEAPNEAVMGRLPPFPFTNFELAMVVGHQSLSCDQLACSDPATGRQRRSYNNVCDHHAFTVSLLDRRNSALSDAPHQVPKYVVGSWAPLYNTAATSRQRAKASTDANVLKTKVLLKWIGPYTIVAIGPSHLGDTPDDSPLCAMLLNFDLPPYMPVPTIRSVAHCKVRANPHGRNDIPG